MSVGYYVRPLIVGVSVDHWSTFGELMDATTADFRTALAVSEVSYEMFTSTDIHSIAGGHVIWVVTYGAESLHPPEGLKIEPLPASIDIARHDLRIALADHGTHMELSVTHRRRTVDGPFANRTSRALGRLLHHVPAREDSVAEVLRRLGEGASEVPPSRSLRAPHK